MRVTRSLFTLVAIAIAVAGCARQPVARLQTTAPLPMAAPAQGIDALVYGAPRAQVVAVPAAPVVSGRGVFAGAALVRVMPRYAAGPVNARAYAPVSQNKAYTLDSGDRLRVVVFGQDGLSNSYLVDASGHIAMPLIGTVAARGLTTDELSSRIAERLRQGFVREPHVAVEVEAYRPFFILGEVTQPGQYPYVADMTVETAVAIAGGFGPRAYRQTVMVTRVISGRQVRMTVPVSFPLRPGDTVNVQERWF